MKQTQHYDENLRDISFEHPPTICKQVIISVISSLFYVSVGVSVGYTGIILPRMTEDIPMSAKQISVYTSIISLGTLIGCFICHPLLLKFGQRKTCLVCIPAAILVWAIPYLSDELWVQCTSRFILGMLMQFFFNGCATYIAEIAHPTMRGKLVALSSMSLQIGSLFVYGVGSTSLDWRTVGLLCSCAPLIPCLYLYLVPDSPRWLSLVRADEEKVFKSLQYFRGKYYCISHEIREIKDSVDSVRSTSIKNQLKIAQKRSVIKRIMLLAYLVAGVSLSGTDVAIVYAISIFQTASPSFNAYSSTMLSGLVRVIGVIAHIFSVDRVGRRRIALLPMLVAALCLFALGLFYYLKFIGYDTLTISWLPLTSMLIYIFCNCLFYPVIILLRTELLPNSVRNLGLNFTSLVYALSSFLVTMAHPLLIDSISHHWTFWMYAVNSLILFTVFFIMVPETQGKSLEEIEKMFS